jgi:DNA helicase-2/ATP-dependent DNA helicase PcrA
VSAPTVDADGRYLAALLGTPFTDEQCRVAIAAQQPTLVVAGAGSGKTTVMAARVVHTVAFHGVAPSAVLGLTFTNKAAGELRRKVREALGKLGGLRLSPVALSDDEVIDDEPNVATYHAYAASLVRDHALRIGREPDTMLLTEARAWQLALSVVHNARGPFAHFKWQPSYVARLVLDLDAEMSEHGVTIEQLLACDAALRAEVDAAPRRTNVLDDLAAATLARDELLTLIAVYRERKRELDLLDYADQVALAGDIAEVAGEVVAGERERFRAVFLDEYQDTSVAQRRLLATLFGGPVPHPVTAVGDPCQAIYGWRGASVGNLLRFAEHFPRADDDTAYLPIYLATSFRNGGRILAGANVVSEELREADPAGRRPHVVVPPLSARTGAEDAGEIRVAFHDTVDAEAAWVADEVRRAVDTLVAFDKDENRRHDVAVLCRRRADFPVFHAALVERGLPVEVVGLGGLLELPEVGDVVAMLEVLVDPTANPALMRVLTGPRYRIGPRDLAALGERADFLARVAAFRASSDPADDPDGVAALAKATESVDPVDVVALGDAIANLGDPAKYSDAAYSRLRALDAEITRLRPLISHPVIDAVTSVIAAIGLDVELEADPDGLAAARMANLAAFCDHAARFEGLADNTDLAAFLDYLVAAREREDGLELGGISAQDTVKLMTVHKAKGLEWRVVAVPCLSARVFPSSLGRPRWPNRAEALPTRLRGDCDDLPIDPEMSSKGISAHKSACQEDEALEERRLAYVAVTRARSRLLASGHAWNRTRTKALEPSVFLNELRDAAIDGAGEVSEWCEDAGAANPVLAVGAADVAWPPSYDAAALARRESAAALVRAALDGATPTEDALLPRLARLAEETSLLITEITTERAGRRVVTLPRTMSTSQLVALAHDPDELARSLARPLPRKPSAAARRGTRFHEWLEQSFGERPLLDRDVLPGAADDVVVDDSDLDELRAAFAASPYADRPVAAVEAPFELLLGGRVLRGRIDAVFDEGDDRWEVVDWKTGESGDPLQLAVYRLAWAELQGVDIGAVTAAFLHVKSGRIERFAGADGTPPLPDRAGLESLLAGR